MAGLHGYVYDKSSLENSKSAEKLFKSDSLYTKIIIKVRQTH